MRLRTLVLVFVCSLFVANRVSAQFTWKGNEYSNLVIDKTLYPETPQISTLEHPVAYKIGMLYYNIVAQPTYYAYYETSSSDIRADKKAYNGDDFVFLDAGKDANNVQLYYIYDYTQEMYVYYKDSSVGGGQVNLKSTVDGNTKWYITLYEQKDANNNIKNVHLIIPSVTNDNTVNSISWNFASGVYGSLGLYYGSGRNSKWQFRKSSDVKPNNIGKDDDNTLFLYNVKTKQFAISGGKHATQLVQNEEMGAKLWLADQKDGTRLVTTILTEFGKNGIATPTEENGVLSVVNNGQYIWDGVYVDRDYLATGQDHPQWHFELVSSDNDDYIYNLYANNKNDYQNDDLPESVTSTPVKSNNLKASVLGDVNNYKIYKIACLNGSNAYFATQNSNTARSYSDLLYWKSGADFILIKYNGSKVTGNEKKKLYYIYDLTSNEYVYFTQTTTGGQTVCRKSTLSDDCLWYITGYNNNNSDYFTIQPYNINEKKAYTLYWNAWENTGKYIGLWNSNDNNSKWRFYLKSDLEYNDNYAYYDETSCTKYYIHGKSTDEWSDVGFTEGKDGNIDEEYYQWKIITMTDIKNKFAETYYSEKYAADATLFVADPNFARRSSENPYWNQDNIEGEVVFNTNDTQGSTQNRFSHYRVTNVSSAKENGMLYQEISVTRPGWYSYQMTGFQNVESQDDVNAYLFAYVGSSKAKDNSLIYPNIGDAQTASNASVKLKWRTWGYYDGSDKAHTLDTSSWLAIGKALADTTDFKDYPNKVCFYVPGDVNNKNFAQTVTIGVFFSESTNDLCSFDDARLKYLGEDIVLEETFADTDNEYNYNCFPIQSSQKFQKPRRTLILARDMNVQTNANWQEGSDYKWNTIVLPISLTRRQFRDAFGMDAQLAVLDESDYGVTNTAEGFIVNFTTVDMFADGMNSNSIVLEANRPYLIRPTMGGRTDPTFKTFTNYPNGYNVTNNFYVIQRVTADYDSSISPEWPSVGYYDEDEETEKWLTFRGLFNVHSKATNNRIDDPFYAFQGGTGNINANGTQNMTDGTYELKYYKNGAQSMGFRALLMDGWYDEAGTFYPNSGNSMYAEASAKTARYCINGVFDDDETTGFISEAVTAETEVPADAPVYTICGKKVNAGNGVTLPKGVYVSKGKKFVVK